MNFLIDTGNNQKLTIASYIHNIIIDNIIELYKATLEKDVTVKCFRQLSRR